MASMGSPAVTPQACTAVCTETAPVPLCSQADLHTHQDCSHLQRGDVLHVVLAMSGPCKLIMHLRHANMTHDKRQEYCDAWQMDF